MNRAARVLTALTRLGNSPPHEPRVSECLPEIIAMIERLIANGAAYTVPSGAGHDVWYAVRQFAGYGKLSGRNLDDLQAGPQGIDFAGLAAELRRIEITPIGTVGGTPELRAAAQGAGLPPLRAAGGQGEEVPMAAPAQPAAAAAETSED